MDPKLPLEASTEAEAEAVPRADNDNVRPIIKSCAVAVAQETEVAGKPIPAKTRTVGVKTENMRREYGGSMEGV